MTTPITGLENNSPLRANTLNSAKNRVQTMVDSAKSNVFVYSNGPLPASEKDRVAVIITAYELSVDAKNQSDTKNIWNLLATLYEQNKGILGGSNSSFEDFQALVADLEPDALRHCLLHDEAKRLGMEYKGYALLETRDGKVGNFSVAFEAPGPENPDKAIPASTPNQTNASDLKKSDEWARKWINEAQGAMNEIGNAMEIESERRSAPID